MSYQLQQIKIQKISKVIQLSPAWVSLFDFIQQHPYVQFEKLKFEAGDPVFANQELKIIESIKF